MNKTTRKQLEEIAEIWFQRAKKLSVIYKNKHETPVRRFKALGLINQLSSRLTRITIALRPKPPKNAQKGGIIRLNTKP